MSLYKVYSRNRFRNAPLSKVWLTCCAFGSTVVLGIPNWQRHVIVSVPDLLTRPDAVTSVMRLLLSRLFYLDMGNIICGCLYIYHMRDIERRFGSRKFFAFVLLVSIFSLLVETLCYHAGDYFNYVLTPFYASSPYCLFASCFILNIMDFPTVPPSNYSWLSVSALCLPYLYMLQLALSSKESILSSIAGMIAGLLYRYDVCSCQSLSVIPERPAAKLYEIMQPFVDLGEDRKGRILPMGATLEAQRLEFYDRLEQQAIFDQIRVQHNQDVNAGRNPVLHAARRWFGGGPGAEDPFSAVQANVVVSDDKIEALVEMGFDDRDRVTQVLRSTNNDLNSAAHILISEGSRAA